MKRILNKMCLLFCLFSISGCVYAQVKRPLDTNVNQTELGSKRGEASIHSVAGLIAWGDSGTQAAAKNGDIKTINHLDSEYLIFLAGLYARMTTIAYGD